MPRAPRQAPVQLSPTGLTRFGECEARWLWHPDEDAPESATGRALSLGTAVHELIRARWKGQDWRARAEAFAAESHHWEPVFKLPDIIETAIWLAERHEAVYPKLPMLVASEFEFDLSPDHDRDLHIRGYQDGLTLVDQAWINQYGPDEEDIKPGIYIIETKTMGKWDRLDWLNIDPQLGSYEWAARKQGFEVVGVLYDAILTQVWKTEEGEVYKTGARKGQPKNYHPPTDSFKRLWLPINEPLVAATLDQYDQVAKRARYLFEHPDEAVKSAGRNCVYCPAYESCHPHAVVPWLR